MICVGYTTELIPNWEDFIEPVTAPRNYKDPAKIAEYIAQRKIAVAEEALSNPMTARLGALCLLTAGVDGKPERVYVAKDATLLDTLSLYGTIVAIKLSALLRLAVLEHLDHGPMTPQHQWALRHDDLPANSLALVDPLRILVGAAQENEIKLAALAVRYSINLDAPAEPGHEMDERAVKLATLAFQFAERMGIK